MFITENSCACDRGKSSSPTSFTFSQKMVRPNYTLAQMYSAVIIETTKWLDVTMHSTNCLLAFIICLASSRKKSDTLYSVLHSTFIEDG